MSQKNYKEILLPIDQIIQRAKARGVAFGHGNPINRLRYLTKVGLLPHATRKLQDPIFLKHNLKSKALKASGTVAHYPESVVDQLIEIDEQLKGGKSIQDLIGQTSDPNPLFPPETLSPPGQTATIVSDESVQTSLATPIPPSWKPASVESEAGYNTSFSVRARDNNSSNILSFLKSGRVWAVISLVSLVSVLTVVSAQTGLASKGLALLGDTPLRDLLTSDQESVAEVQSASNDISNPNSLNTVGTAVLADSANLDTLQIQAITTIIGPVTLTDQLNANGGIVTNGADVNLDTGELTASNVIYGIVAGDNVSVSDGQTPTISVDLTGIDIPELPANIVNTVQGQTGDITLVGGTDISISGLTISNTSTLSSITGRGATTNTAVSLTGGASITGLTLTGLDCTSNTNGGALTTNAAGLISCSNDDGGSLTADSLDFDDFADSMTIDDNTVISQNSNSLTFRGPDYFRFDSLDVGFLNFANCSGCGVTGADSIDFIHLDDSMELDANTLIDSSSFTLTFRGGSVLFDSANISTLTLTNPLVGTGVINSTNILDETITSSDLSADSVGSSELIATGVSAGTYGDSSNFSVFTVDADGRLTSAGTIPLIINGSAISADTLDFTEFRDSMVLDANTVISNSSFSLSFRGPQNYIFDSAAISTLSLTNQLIGTGVINTGNILNGTIVAADLSADSLNFTELADSLLLDANTVLDTSSFTFTFRGPNAVVFDSANISTLTLTNALNCTGCITGTNILDDTITATDISADSVGSSELIATGVTPGTYGDTGFLSTFTVDADGRLTSAGQLAITGSSISADSLDFINFEDSLELDANTVISSSSFNLSFRGNTVSFDSANISTLTLTNPLIGTGVISSTNLIDETITSSDISADSVGASELIATGVSAGTYGDSSNFSVFTVDGDGRLTSAGTIPFSTTPSADSLDFIHFQDSLELDANSVISSSDFTLSFRGPNSVLFDSATISTLTLTNQIIGTGVVNSTNILDGTIAAADISSDSLNFTELADSLVLDNNTLISSSDFTLTFRGNSVVFDSATVTSLTLTNALNCTGCITSTNILDGTIVAADISADALGFTELADSLTIDTNTVISQNSNSLSFRGPDYYRFDSIDVGFLNFSSCSGCGVTGADSIDFIHLEDSMELDANTVISSSSFNLSFRGNTVNFDSANISTLTLTNPLVGTGVINSTNILDGTIVGADVSADAFNFTEFADSLVLDANTVIDSSSFTLTFRGANPVVFDSANISTLTLTNPLVGTGVINTVNILDGTIVGADISADALDFAQLADSMTIDSSSVITQNSNSLAFRGPDYFRFDSIDVGFLSFANCSGCGIAGADSLDFIHFDDSMELDADTVISSSSFNLSFRGNTVSFDSANISTLTLTNPLVGTGVINSTNILDGTIVATDISADSLNFTALADSLVLDANTVISSSDFSLSFRGNPVVFDSANTGQLRINTLNCTTSAGGGALTTDTSGNVVCSDDDTTAALDSIDFIHLEDSMELDADTVINSSSFTLTFRGNSVVFDSANISTLTLTNPLVGTGVINSTNILDATIVALDISSDTLNFTELADSLVLDASTVISNSSFTLSFRGPQYYVFDSANISTLNLSNLVCTGCINSTNILDGTILAADISADSLNFTEFGDSLALDANTVISSSSFTLSFRGPNSFLFDSASISTLTLTNPLVGTGVINSTNILDETITSSDISADSVGASELISTTVTPGTYGDTGFLSTFTVDADGRLTSAGQLAITGSSISADSLDFINFEDSLELDANTVISSSSFNLSFRGNTVSFDSANISTLTLTNQLIGTGVVNSTNILNGTIVDADLSADTLDFTELADSLLLDANTVIDSSSFTLSFRGANSVLFDSATISTLTVTNPIVGTGIVNTGNILNGTILGTDVSADSFNFTEFADSLLLDANTVISSSDFTLTFRGNPIVFDSVNTGQLRINTLNCTTSAGGGSLTTDTSGNLVCSDDDTTAAVDSLDFIHFEDSMELDANTVISSSDFTLTFRGPQGVVFDSATINQLTLNCTGCITSTNILDGTIVAADISADTLDFTEFQDSLDLDSNLVITQGTNIWQQTYSGTSNPALSLSSTGAVTSGNASVLDLQTTNAGTTVDGVHIANSGSGDALQIDQRSTSGGFALNVNGRNSIFNSSQDGALGAWTNNTTTLPASINTPTSVVANGYVYVLGGFDGSNPQSRVYYAKLNADGSIGAFSTSSNFLPTGIFTGTSVAGNGYLYVIGGENNRTNVYYAKVNSDGSTGSWNSSVNTLPASRAYHASIYANGYIYVLGGSHDNGATAHSTVYYSKLNPDGTNGAWSTNAHTLPSRLRSPSAISANGYVYVIGGEEDESNERSAIYYARLNSDGSTGSWTTTFLPASRGRHTSVVLNGYLYVLGGNDSSGDAQSTVYYSKLNSDGSLGNWSTNVYTIPQERRYHASVVANGYIYVVAGDNQTSTKQNNIYYTSGPRVSLAGTLDLIGQSGQTLGDSTSSSSFGSSGSNLYAGNIFSNGTLEVGGNAQFWNGLNVVGGLRTDTASTGSLQIVGFNCGLNANGGALTTDANGFVTCSDDNDGGASSIADDSLDFVKFDDSLELDADTVISSSSFALTFRGNPIVFDSVNTGQLRINTLNCTTSANGGALTTDVNGNLVCSDDNDGGASSIADDSLDFIKFDDSLELDDHTVISSSNFNLTFRGNTVTFDSANITTLTLTNPLIGTGVINTTNILNGTILATDISADSFNFTELSDSLILDANTVISSSDFTLTFRGNSVIFDSASISTLTITNPINCTGCVTSTNILNGTIVDADLSTDTLDFTELEDSLELDAHTVISSSDFNLSFRGNAVSFDSANISTLTLTNALNCTGCITSTNILDGTIVGSDISVDSLDFAQLEDSLDLDANTVVSSGSNTLTFRGSNAVVFDSANISTLTLTNQLVGTNVIDSTNIDDESITSTDILNGTIVSGDLSADTLDFTSLADSLLLDANTVISSSSFALTFRGNPVVFDSANTGQLRINTLNCTTSAGGGALTTDSSGNVVCSDDDTTAAVDSLDFIHFEDSMELDANTVISSSDFTLTFRGPNAVVFDSANISTLTLTNPLVGTGVINSSNILNGTILAADLSSDTLNFTEFADSLVLDANTVIDSSSFTLTFRGANAVVFDSANISTLTLTNALNCTGCISSGNVLDGTLVAADISADSLDFAQLEDSLDLDANTVISSGANTLTFRGANAVVFDSANISTLTLTNPLIGTGVINSTNILNGTIVSADVSADALSFTELADSLLLDTNTVIDSSSFALTFRGNPVVFDSANTGQLRINTLNCTTSAGGGALTTDSSGNLVCSDDDTSAAADSLDFIHFEDSLELDANTVISSSSFNLSFRGNTVNFDSANISTLTLTNQLIGTGVINTGNILDGTILAADLSVDSLDFDRFEDSMDLDASTVITTGANQLAIRGAGGLAADSASISTLTLTNPLVGTGVINSTNILNGTILGADISSDTLNFTELSDSLALDANTVLSSSNFTLSFRGANAVVFDSANISTLTLTNVLNGTGVINSTNILNGTILATDVSSDTLNFTQLADSLLLDANTVINSSSFTLSFRGANSVLFDSATISTLTVTNPIVGTGIVNSTNILNGTIVDTDLSADTLDFTELEPSLELDENTVISNSSFTLTFRGPQYYVFDSIDVGMLNVANCTGCANVAADSLDFIHFEDSLELDANTVISSSDFTLSFRGANAVVFDSANISTLTLTNVLNGTGVINSTNILNDTILSADISADTLDFVDFEESLDLDADTVITTGASTLSFRGANSVLFDSATVSTLTLANQLVGTNVIDSTNIDDGGVLAVDISADALDFAQFQDTLDLDTTLVLNQSTNFWEQNFTGTTGPAFDLNSTGAVTSGAAAGLNIDITSATTTVDGVHIANSGTGDALQIDQRSTSPGFALNVNGRNSIFNSSQDGNVGAWSTSVYTVPDAFHGAGAAIVNGYMYIYGGGDSTSNSFSAVYYSKIQANVNVSDWFTSTNFMPDDLHYFGATSHNGYLYALGGRSDATDRTSRVYYTKVNSDGTTAAWATNTATIPQLLAYTASTSANGYTYIVGGDGSLGRSHVYYGKYNSDGSISAFSATAFLPSGRDALGVTTANGYVYAIGGYDGTNVQSQVFYSKIQTNGSLGAWSTNAFSLPARLQEVSAVVSNGYMYVIGGKNGSDVEQSTVYYAKLNSDGSTGSWSTSAYTLPTGAASNSLLLANGYIYSVNGINQGNANTDSVHYTSTARVSVAGNLDLLGQNGSWLGDSSGSVGGSITAGDILSVGNLEIMGATSLWDGLNIGGNTTTNGDITAVQTRLDGANIANGAGAGTTSLILDDASAFDINNYVQINGTYAKITNKSSNTLTISPALTWSDNNSAREYKIPEIGGSGLSKTVENRFGRVYAIDGLVAGNSSTYYTDNRIIIENGASFDITDSDGNSLFSVIDGGTSGIMSFVDALDFDDFSDSMTLDASTVITQNSNSLSFRGPDYFRFDSIDVGMLNVANCVGCSSVAGDSLDFTHFEDSMELDTDTVISSSNFALTFRGANAFVFDSANVSTLTLTNQLVGTNVIDSSNIDDGSITSTDILDGTILAADLSVDSLDFDRFEDSLDLDSNTVISSGSNTLTFRGANTVVFDSASIATLTVTNPIVGTGIVNSTNILNDTILSADVSADALDFIDFEESLDLDANTVVSNGSSTMSFRGPQYYVFDSIDVNMLNVTNCTGCSSVAVDSLDFTHFEDSLDLDANTVVTSGSNTLTFRGANAVVFDSATIEKLTLTSVLGGTDVINAANVVDGALTGTDISNGSLLAADLSVDSLDFDQFQDSLDLDANTVITTGASNLVFRGANAIVFDSSNISTLTITNQLIGTNVVDSTNIDDGSITSTDILNDTILSADVSADALDFVDFEESLDLDVSTVLTTGSNQFVIRGSGGLTADSADISTLTLTNQLVGTNIVDSTNIDDGGVLAVDVSADALDFAQLQDTLDLDAGLTWNTSSFDTTVRLDNGNDFTFDTNGNTGAWSSNVYTIPGVMRGTHTSVMANGYVYVLGGHNGSDFQSTVYYSRLNPDGSTGAWSTNVYTIPGVARGNHSSVVANGYLYVVGGRSDATTYRSTVYYSKLNADGTTGTWSSSVYTLPSVSSGANAGIGFHQSIVANGYLYVLGGYNGTVNLSSVYYAKLNGGGGNLGWTSSPHTVPNHGAGVGLSDFGVATANGYVYITGGNNNSSKKSGVYYSKLNSDGSNSTWTAATFLPIANSTHTSVAVNGYLYVIGGENSGGTELTSVYYSKINTDGTIGSWSISSATIPQRGAHATVASNDYIYVLGGGDGSNYSPTVYYASLGRTSVVAGLEVTGDTQFWNSITIGNTDTYGSGIKLSAQDGLTFHGSARPQKTIGLNAEYPGSAITAFYGAGTDTNISGSMTSDSDTSGNKLRNYYTWNRTQATQHFQTIAVRVKLPHDFDAWAPANAIEIDYMTESTTSTNSLLDFYIYNGDDTPGTSITSSTNNVSGSANVWTTATVDDSALVNGSAPEWDGYGETAVIYLRMGSQSGNEVRIGDIRLNYLARQ